MENDCNGFIGYRLFLRLYAGKRQAQPYCEKNPSFHNQLLQIHRTTDEEKIALAHQDPQAFSRTRPVVLSNAAEVEEI